MSGPHQREPGQLGAIAADHIRLLKLFPSANPDAPLRGTLFPVPLESSDTANSFHVLSCGLSYDDSDEPKSAEIALSISQPASGSRDITFPISAVLQSALLQVRHPRINRILFVRQICVDFSSRLERVGFTFRARFVYGRCKRIFIYLPASSGNDHLPDKWQDVMGACIGDPESLAAAVAAAAKSKLNRPSWGGFKELVKDKMTKSQIQADLAAIRKTPVEQVWGSLIGHAYFRSPWAYPELVLPPEIDLLLPGKVIMSWTDLHDVLSGIEERIERQRNKILALDYRSIGPWLRLCDDMRRLKTLRMYRACHRHQCLEGVGPLYILAVAAGDGIKAHDMVAAIHARFGLVFHPRFGLDRQERLGLVLRRLAEIGAEKEPRNTSLDFTADDPVFFWAARRMVAHERRSMTKVDGSSMSYMSLCVLLNDPRRHVGRDTLPSWVPDFHKNLGDMADRYEKKGRPSRIQSALRESRLRLGTSFQREGYSLRLYAAVLDMVTVTTSPCFPLDSAALQLGYVYTSPKLDHVDAAARQLVADLRSLAADYPLPSPLDNEAARTEDLLRRLLEFDRKYDVSRGHPRKSLDNLFLLDDPQGILADLGTLESPRVRPLDVFLRHVDFFFDVVARGSAALDTLKADLATAWTAHWAGDEDLGDAIIGRIRVLEAELEVDGRPGRSSRRTAKLVQMIARYRLLAGLLELFKNPWMPNDGSLIPAPAVLGPSRLPLGRWSNLLVFGTRTTTINRIYLGARPWERTYSHAVSPNGVLDAQHHPVVTESLSLAQEVLVANVLAASNLFRTFMRSKMRFWEGRRAGATARGWVCNLPVEAQEGDMLAVMGNCDYMCVLRPVEGDGDDGRTYSLVGHAVVDAFAEGSSTEPPRECLGNLLGSIETSRWIKLV